MKFFKRRETVRAPSVSLGETIKTLRSYVLQETLGPLRHIAKMLGFGLAGALLCGIGSVLSLLAVLRILQGETGHVFAGNWSFVPYVLTALTGALLIGLGALTLLRRIGRREPS